MKELHREMIIDITRTLGLDTVSFPDDADFSASYTRASGYALSSLVMSSHSGTHIDAPLHFFEGRESLDEVPVERFFLDADVIEIESPTAVTISELDSYPFKPGQAVLFKTRNSDLPRERFHENFVYIESGAARWLIDRGVSLVGFDYISVERYDDMDFPVHIILLGAGALILEDIDLRSVEPGRYHLTCLPIKTVHADGAPCRAVLRRLL
ncbi:MAG: cyclase family protein [Candidatus Methanogaster sp.]|uniref:Cyclase family protein n=1 Tax=Candidatus Methanogaster sp. TaxID=3386292 RepID=A0AC61L766_9EURY|nr:MAG: cyclase family protein [ANME-2 cluster archaeon]